MATMCIERSVYRGMSAMSLQSTLRGRLGEFQGIVTHQLFLDAHTYRSLNNVILLGRDGTTQIDHVLVSRYGIFVVEAKNMSGEIFGGEYSPQWTQNLYGHKHRFPNPLQQNYRYTAALAEFVGLDADSFVSVVIFWGDCEFKSPLPSNVVQRGQYTAYIKSKTDVCFSDDEVTQIAQTIHMGRLPRKWHARREHSACLHDKCAPEADSA